MHPTGAISRFAVIARLVLRKESFHMARRHIPLLAVGACLGVSSAALAQITPCSSPIGPDVVVGDMPTPISYFGTVGTSPNQIAAYSFATTSCDMGNAPVRWSAGTREHPVIGQN